MKEASWKTFISNSLGLFLFSVEIYLRYFAPQALRKSIEPAQIDKVLHLLGGIFIAILIERYMKAPSFLRVLGITFVLMILWKVFEYFLDPAMPRFIMHHLSMWVIDTIGDITATIFGGLLYWYVAIQKTEMVSESHTEVPMI